MVPQERRFLRDRGRGAVTVTRMVIGAAAASERHYVSLPRGVLMFRGPPIDDPDLLPRLSAAHRELLETVNGYVAYHGGLHVRGACLSPMWHSLREGWFGANAIHRLFSAVSPDDVPFAQDALGDQFVLRDGCVWKLDAEVGELNSLNMALWDFDAAVRADPDGFLNLEPLRRFQAEGGTLEPGQLLSVMPPFVVKHEGNESYRAISAQDRLNFLSHLAAQLRDVPDGAHLRFHVEPGGPGR